MTLTIRCPLCSTEVRIPATDTADLPNCPSVSVADEDWADLWAHLWTHQGEPA